MASEQRQQQPPAPICMGTGLIALDIVTSGEEEAPPRFWAGGTCGNVLTILAYLGWRSYPVVRLGDDSAAKRIARDMRQYNVDLRYLSYDENVNTPIVVERIFPSTDGTPTHRFYWVCPNCGNWLPRYRPVPLREVEALSEGLPKMTCFFFDRVSAAALYLAKKARGQGALVVFEPPRIKESEEFEQAIDACDILKYSNERTKNFTKSAYESSAHLVIETLGAEGLRYRLRREGRCEEWKLLRAFCVTNVRDAAGAGDWCSAGIIEVLGKVSESSIELASEERIIKALRYGQALSALNCSFEGARGAMYGLNKNEFNREVHAILDQKQSQIPVVDALPSKAKKAIKCICPGCQI
jgi:sugar/nucleoside kinase (ribokinase family)